MDPASALFEDWTEVSLAAKDLIPRGRLDFPRMAYTGELPTLLAVRSRESGRTLIAGASWWGNPKLNPEINVVRVSPAILQELEGSDDQPSGERHPRVIVRRARWYDIVVYVRGFWIRTWLALSGSVAAIAGAAVGFASGTAPLGWALLVLVLACCTEIGRALKRLADAAHGR